MEELGLICVAVVSVLYAVLSHAEKKRLALQLAEAMRIVASPGYQAFAAGKQLEARADAPRRELSQAEIDAAVEAEVYARAEGSPHSTIDLT